MRIFDPNGKPHECEAVDAHEKVRFNGYTYTHPDYPEEDPNLSRAEVLTRTEEGQREATKMSHARAAAEDNAKISQRETPKSPADYARDAAVAARRAADEAIATASLTVGNPVAAKRAEDAVKTAEEMERRADEEQKLQEENQARATKARGGKQNGREAKAAADEEETGDQFDTMLKDDLKAWLDKRKIDYPADSLKEDLQKLARQANKK